MDSTRENIWCTAIGRCFDFLSVRLLLRSANGIHDLILAQGGKVTGSVAVVRTLSGRCTMEYQDMESQCAIRQLYSVTPKMPNYCFV